MKASNTPTRWATYHEASALVALGWTVLSYGTAGQHFGQVLLSFRG